ncbi:hypothetical protein AJ79_02998 [Helicocarpus griseus UAMH5409]|uniref:RRM domain-containing protein n=1 Tax=Helicocarpus griseus UAMH5409 TaxID=1447875 RepID=A0A2B7XZY3_9EURO|nr:hypothetical protein AJ79_02998 [Helicocarpus griseus UAMH5409]
MADKLDKSLDDILSTRRGGGRRAGQRRRTSKAASTAAAAPVGGVKKTTRNARSISKAIPTTPSLGLGESKIIVSGLPSDVNEANIKLPPDLIMRSRIWSYLAWQDTYRLRGSEKSRIARCPSLWHSLYNPHVMSCALHPSDNATRAGSRKRNVQLTFALLCVGQKARLIGSASFNILAWKPYLDCVLLEYFHKSAGPVKKVMLTYNQNGTSRGIAAITFVRPDTAAKAAKELNGLLIDKRPIKIEVVLDASRAPAPPAAKPLTERVAQPKPQPKPVSAAKATAGSKRGRARRGRNAGRPKPKTVEELDAEMEDYFPANNAAPAATNGAAAPPAANAGEDLGMDEISVC